MVMSDELLLVVALIYIAGIFWAAHGMSNACEELRIDGIRAIWFVFSGAIIWPIAWLIDHVIPDKWIDD